MAKDLVIVESPAKARTVQRFLGNKYVAKASMGHVRDLPKTKMGIEIEDDSFTPTYRVMNDKRKVVTDLTKSAKSAGTVYLATDPDREGEAISWHLVEAAKIPLDKTRRVVFHEITREAIHEAFDHPRELDYNLIDAQQARRLLDRLVGYRLSPVLWGKVKRGLSAGRVQSVALRLVVDREREIDAFTPVEYWTIDANLAKRLRMDEKRIEFKAALHSLKGRRKKIEIPNGDEAARLTSDLDGAEYAVASVRKRQTRSRPSPPFITSTLQQEASRKLRFTARRTMVVAQQLYEGLNIGSEGSGRPDYLYAYRLHERRGGGAEGSGRLHQERVRRGLRAQVAQDIHPQGEGRAGSARGHTPHFHHARSAGHTPIPEQRAVQAVRPHLEADARQPDERRAVRFDQGGHRGQAAASRTLCICSAPPARFSSSRATASCIWRARTTRLPRTRKRRPCPNWRRATRLTAWRCHSDQHFTQPPPRFTEATLIRALEERGIGRPSTYAPILATIMDRDYVQKENNRFVPTRLGTVVTDLLTANFPDIMDVGFTATMEEQLDDVAEGEREWEPVLKDFYHPFDLSIEKAMKEAERVPRELLDEATDEVCEKCEKPMVIKSGRYGRFLACTGYPECRNTRPVETEEERALRERVSEDIDEFCEKCERPMVVKTGRNGRFLACSGYPECKNAKPFLVGVDCPDCGGGLAERKQKGRNGRIFYGCVNYPECKFTANPLPQPCPDCGKLLVTQGRGRKNARCLDEGCGFTGPVAELDAPELEKAS